MYREEIRAIESEIDELFRDFHRHPELGYGEVRTARIVAEYLRGLGLSVKEGVALTGVVAELDSGRPGKTLMLRADMDCLALKELAKTGYESQNEGRMHACGHDAHVTILLAAAKVLSRHTDQFDGKIRFLFQPAEEGIPVEAKERVRAAGYDGEGGAGFMIREGALEGVDACAIMHVQPSLPVGTVSIARKNACASSDIFRIELRGKGGHGARPQEAVDPVPALAELISAVHMLPTREVSTLETCVISIGALETPGSVWNAVAEKVCLAGGIRTFNTEVRELLNRRVRELAENIAAANRCSAEVTRVVGYMPCINDEGIAAAVAESCAQTLGRENVIFGDVPAMTSEDCGAYLEKVPGAFFWLGVGTEAGVPPLHSPYFRLDTDALVLGVEIHVTNAISLLKKLNSKGE